MWPCAIGLTSIANRGGIGPPPPRGGCVP
jgi:hypothetical protein